MAEQPSICSAIGTNLRRVPPYSHGVGIWIMLPECQQPLILSHAHMVNGNLQCIVLRNGKEVMHRSYCIHTQGGETLHVSGARYCFWVFPIQLGGGGLHVCASWG